MSTQTSTSAEPTFREATNLLRGICAFSVLLWHYQNFFWNLNDSRFEVTRQPFYKLFQIPYTMGSIGVPIFWCISGLILIHSYQNSVSPTLQKFFISRLSRLYPLHFVTLLIVAALQQISLRAQATYQIYSQNDIFHFILNLFFIQSWGFENGRSFNAPSWSVSTEMIVYLIFFYTLRFVKRVKLVGAISLFLIFSSELTSLVNLNNLIFFRECLAYFFLGVSLYYLSDIKLKILRDLGVFISLLLILWGSTESQDSHPLLVGALVALFAFFDLTTFTRFFRPLRRLGELSYSIFLWHVPLQIALLLILDMFSIDLTIAYNHFFFLSFVLLTYFVGYLSYRYIEQPAQRYLRQKLISA
jgi:peptidoglycan/LPS O-acetylase OafA/YrhL